MKKGTGNGFLIGIIASGLVLAYGKFMKLKGVAEGVTHAKDIWKDFEDRGGH